MEKERLSKVKSSVQLDYTVGMGTGWDGDTSETSWAKPEIQVLVWHQLLAAGFLIAQPEASTRSEAGCSEPGLDYDRAGWAFLQGSCSTDHAGLVAPHRVAQWVSQPGPGPPAHMCRRTCYKMENECPHSPGAFWLEAKQIHQAHLSAALTHLLSILAYPTFQVP